MNSSQYCANCHAHGWKQLEDKTQLQRCKNCKVVQYCGVDCQRDHWKKVHKNQCQLFVNSANTEDWGHKEDNCLACRQATDNGTFEFMTPNNPNYGCVYKDFNFPQNCCSPHPFPINGQPGDIMEKAIMVSWHLLHKFAMTNPEIVPHTKEELFNVYAILMKHRLHIWEVRKVFQNPVKLDFGEDPFWPLHKIRHEVKRNELTEDALQLWNTVDRVFSIYGQVCYGSNRLEALKDPLNGLSEELKELVSQGLVNQAKYLAMANQVLEALATQVIPYQEVLKIICGGSLNQTCSFCSQEIVVATVDAAEESPSVSFTMFSVGTYSCSKRNCFEKGTKLRKDSKRMVMTLLSLVNERLGNRCDFCLQLPPINDVHRCSECLSTVYCNKNCQNEDWKIHKIYCNKDMEERKKKFGPSFRRKKAREGIDGLEKYLKGVHKQLPQEFPEQTFDMLPELKLKNAKKKP